MRIIIVLLFVTLLFTSVIMGQQAADHRPSAISTQALWALIATWLGLGIGFFGVVLTIRRDRAAANVTMANFQDRVDSRTREVVHAVLNDSKHRDRADERTREIVRGMAYTEFKYDPRANDRLDTMERDVRRLHDDLVALQRELQARNSIVPRA